METAFPLNIILFKLINASATPNDYVILTAKGFAVFGPWLVIGILILYWFLGTVESRCSLMIAGVALGLGLAVNFSITSVSYVPRPFQLGVGNTILAHRLETSFPSDHATFLWSLGVGLLMTSALSTLGIVVCGLGLTTAWARVYLGVHFPLDMAASFVISLLAAIVARSLAGTLDGIFFQPVERINAALLTLVRRPWKKPGE